MLEVLKGDGEAVEIARAYNIHPTSVSRWKQACLLVGRSSWRMERRYLGKIRRWPDMRRGSGS